MIAAASLVAALSLQSRAPHSGLDRASPLPGAWTLLGSRRRSGAPVLWAQTVAAYAAGSLSAAAIEPRVDACLRLDPDFHAAPRMGVLMSRTLPGSATTTASLLRRGLRAVPEDPWYATTLALDIDRGALLGAPDEPPNLLSRASKQDPSLVDLSRRLRP